MGTRLAKDRHLDGDNADLHWLVGDRDHRGVARRHVVDWPFLGAIIFTVALYAALLVGLAHP